MIANNMMPSEPVHPRRFRTHQPRLAAFFRTDLRLNRKSVRIEMLTQKTPNILPRTLQNMPSW